MSELQIESTQNYIEIGSSNWGYRVIETRLYFFQLKEFNYVFCDHMTFKKNSGMSWRAVDFSL